MNEPDQQLLFFSTLLQLENQARHAKNTKELIFTIVNETVRLIRYRQAILWQPNFRGNPQIKAVSGIDTPDKNAPYIIYTHALLKHLNNNSNQVCQIVIEDLPDSFKDGWQEWSLGALLWAPLITPSGDQLGGLIFTRDTEWKESEISLAQRMAEAYAHALAALQKRRSSQLKYFKFLPKRILQLLMLILVIFLMDQPVRLSALAPMEIVPYDPHLVTSPLAGVIDDFFIEPNQPVKKGDPLFTLDSTATQNEYQIAKKSLTVMETEYKREKQKSFIDPQSRAVLQSILASIEQQKSEIAFIKDQLSRSKVIAEQNGITVFGDVHDWLGRPVATGERIMRIADPQKIEIEIMLPVADAINLKPGADILLFLNIKPDSPLSAKLRQASFEAVVTKENILAFRLKAKLDSSDTIPRIGLRGTAKIYGQEVSLFYYLMRKPMISVRQMLGI